MSYPKVNINKLSAVNILGISITSESKKTILEYINMYLGNRKQETGNGKIGVLTIVTPNPEIVMMAQKDKKYKEILNKADIRLPDGYGLVWANRLGFEPEGNGYRNRIKERIPGVEFMEELIKVAVKQHVRIGLIGGKAGVALSALECLRQKYPQLDGWAIDGPDVTMENHRINIKGTGYRVQGTGSVKLNTIGKNRNLDGDEYIKYLIKRIISTKTGMLFVGFGVPKQEYLINILSSWSDSQTNNHQLSAMNPLILMAVGGSFDILSGNVPRAPGVIKQLGLEWLWRLGQEPWRWKRQIVLIKYVFDIFRYILLHK